MTMHMQVANMSTQALAGTSTKDKRRRHLSEAAFQDSIYITAKEGGAHSRDFRCPQCGACDALFRHEHLLPDNFWSYNDTAYQGAIFAASASLLLLCRQGTLPACRKWHHSLASDSISWLYAVLIECNVCAHEWRE